MSGGVLDYSGSTDLLAAHGHAGTLLLDPYNVIIQTTAGSRSTLLGGRVHALGQRIDPDGRDPGKPRSPAAMSPSVPVRAEEIPATSVVANNLTWATGNLLTLSAAGGITINSGVTISNTYAGGVFGAGSVPVVLALRADNASAVNGSGVSVNSFGVTNNGMIDMSRSSGAVSIFNDKSFVAVNGVETRMRPGPRRPTGASRASSRPTNSSTASAISRR